MLLCASIPAMLLVLLQNKLLYFYAKLLQSSTQCVAHNIVDKAVIVALFPGPLVLLLGSNTRGCATVQTNNTTEIVSEFSCLDV